MHEKIKSSYEAIGLPRVIIVSFFLILLFVAGLLDLSILSLMSDAIRRWGMYGILVLAMVPAVQCGIGLNFGISLGIVSGLLGATIVIELGITNPWIAIFLAIVIAVTIALIVGIGYGVLLNRVKGSEMTVSTYVGFSVIAFMNIMWLTLPFRDGDLIWPLGGVGMRNTISLTGSFGEVLSNTPLSIQIGEKAAGLYIPTGLLIFFFIMCLIVYLFMKSKTGLAMTAVGSNPVFARSTGVNVNKMRIVGTAASTALGAVGIIIYAQSYGFLQLYNAPLMMGFHCVAAILIGGATISKAKISHVIIGTFLFQGILAVALPVANAVLPEGNLSDVLRIIISNGIILYALSNTKGGKDGE
ncbi:MAG TPA: ABC transporter [Clostridiales bacterium]|nr:ABC transporter [Clostridiales bacterium]